jgi:hypothetical protein
VQLPQLEEAIYRAHFQRGHQNNQHFAQCIFRSNLEESHQLLQEHYGSIPLKLIQAALSRPNNDCDALYLKEAMKKKTVDELHEILSNHNTIALRLIIERSHDQVFIPQKVVEVVIPPPSPQRDDEFLNQLVDEWMKMEQLEVIEKAKELGAKPGAELKAKVRSRMKSKSKWAR